MVNPAAQLCHPGVCSLSTAWYLSHWPSSSMASSWPQGGCRSSGHHRLTRVCTEPGREGAAPHSPPFAREGPSSGVRGVSPLNLVSKWRAPSLCREAGRPGRAAVWCYFPALQCVCVGESLFSGGRWENGGQRWCHLPVVAGSPFRTGSRVCVLTGRLPLGCRGARWGFVPPMPLGTVPMKSKQEGGLRPLRHVGKLGAGRRPGIRALVLEQHLGDLALVLPLGRRSLQLAPPSWWRVGRQRLPEAILQV